MKTIITANLSVKLTKSHPVDIVIKKGLVTFLFSDKMEVSLKLKENKKNVLFETVIIDGKKIEKIKHPFVLDQDFEVCKILGMEKSIEIGRWTSTNFELTDTKLLLKDSENWNQKSSQKRSANIIYSEPVVLESNIERFSNMITLQDDLNTATAGENWKDGVAANGKIINWFRTIYLEGAELIESYPYKHWKDVNKEPDWGNIQIETVDIWHFLQSQTLVEQHMQKTIASYDLNIPEFLNDAYLEALTFSKDDNGSGLELTELILNIASEYSIDETNYSIDNFSELCVIFFRLTLTVFDNGLDDLEKLYYGKNALNGLRQNNGYKEGTYIKIWNDEGEKVEDNVVMTRLLNTHFESLNKEEEIISQIVSILQTYYDKYVVVVVSEETTYSKLELLAKIKNKFPDKSYNVGHVTRKAKKVLGEDSDFFTEEQVTLILEDLLK